MAREMDLYGQQRDPQTSVSNLPYPFQEQHPEEPFSPLSCFLQSKSLLAPRTQDEHYLMRAPSVSCPKQNASSGLPDYFFSNENEASLNELWEIERPFNTVCRVQHPPMEDLAGIQRPLNNLAEVEPPLNDLAGIPFSLEDNCEMERNANENPLNDLAGGFQHINEEECGPSSSLKKVYHNLRERDRRKKLKDLYADLRQLLPNPNPKKRLSIPNTVCRVLKYIPELRSQLEKLTKRRDELRTATEKASRRTSESLKRSAPDDFRRNILPTPLVTVCPVFGRSELIVTICTFRNQGFRFSVILAKLEASGLDIVNASSFVSEKKICHNVHVQMRQPRTSIDSGLLQVKLFKLLKNSREEALQRC